MNRKTVIMQSLVFLTVVALGLLVSCSNNIMDNKVLENDTLVYATFDKNNSRESSTYTQTIKLEDISNVYWTYTAKKADTAGTKGQKTSQTAVKSDFGKGLDGVIGPFSQGEWDFTVYGYTKGPNEAKSTDSDAKEVGDNVYYSGLIYGGSASKAKLTTGTEEHPDPIDAIIKLLASGTGTFAIKNTSDFHWNTTGGNVSEEAVESKESSDSTSTTITKKIDMYLKLEGRKEKNSSQTDYIKLTFVAANNETKTSAYYKVADGEVVLWEGTDAGSFDLTASIVRAEKTTTTTQDVNTSTSTPEVSYKDLNIYATSPTLVIKVYTGQTTTLEANVIEGNFAYGIINGTIEGKNLSTTTTVTETIESGVDTVLSSSISPASVSSESVSTGNSTTVTIPSTVASFTSGSTASMTVTATPIVTANSTYIISNSSKGAVGAIEISAAVIDSVGTSTSVTEFKDSEDNAIAVTVVTYIAKGMTNVKVTYNGTGDNPTDIAYEADTGKLTYKTTHFSTFLVGADQNVYDESTNTAYTLGSDGKIKDADGEEKAIANLGSSLVLFDCTLSNDVLDKWIKSYDNEDGKTWEVVHHNCSASTNIWHEESSYYDNGYGTKLEPYIVTDKEDFQNITNMYSKYAYYKLADNYSETELTGWTPVTLHGSFDGNGKELTDVTACLFNIVGYELKDEEILLKNFDATLNISALAEYGTGSLIKNVFNSGTTTFENINVHGKIDGFWNLGSFYNYGTANYGNGTGASYTVVFKNCKSDATLICTTGNNGGGFVGHGYEGANNALTLSFDSDCEYTGEFYTTNGNGKKYIAMWSSWGGGKDTITIGTAEYKGTNWDEAWNTYSGNNNKKITKVVPTLTETGYTISVADNVSYIVVSVNAQLTAYDERGNEIPNLKGITLALGNEKKTGATSSTNLLGKVTSAKINNNAESYGYQIANDEMTVDIPGNCNYKSGTVRLTVSQYDSSNVILAAGTIDLCTINKD